MVLFKHCTVTCKYLKRISKNSSIQMRNIQEMTFLLPSKFSLQTLYTKFSEDGKANILIMTSSSWKISTIYVPSKLKL